MRVIALLLVVAVAAAHAAPAEDAKETTPVKAAETPAPAPVTSTTTEQPPTSTAVAGDATRDEQVDPANPVNGTCACAGFKGATYTDEEEPIGTKNMSFTVPCNSVGRKECKDMCVALAQANKLKAPAKTCELVKDVEEGIKPGLYSKACDAPKWTYTGSRNPDRICCRGGKPVSCKPKAAVVPPAPVMPEVPVAPAAPIKIELPVVLPAPIMPQVPVVLPAPIMPDVPMAPPALVTPEVPVVPDAPAVPQATTF